MVTEKISLGDVVAKCLQGHGFILRTNGDIEQYDPTIKHGAQFVYDVEDVKKKCRINWIELAYFSDKLMYICDEEGLLNGSIQNLTATLIWNVATGYSNPIMGDVVICHKNALR
jgi:hypothetical protein